MVICGRRYARSKLPEPERESELPASAKPLHCTPKSARGPYCDRLVRQQIGRDNRDRSQRDLVCRSMRSTILRSTSLLCSIHPTSSQICTTHTATRFKTARYAVRVTGPSATPDIEGVLKMTEGWVSATRRWCYLRLTIYAARSAASDRDSAMSGIFGCGSSRNKAILAASKSGVFAIVANGGA